MKKIIIMIAVMMLISTTYVFSQALQVPESQMFWWQKVILLLVGGYELVIRILPTVKDWTVLGNIFKLLKYVSDFLNAEKKK